MPRLCRYAPGSQSTLTPLGNRNSSPRTSAFILRVRAAVLDFCPDGYPVALQRTIPSGRPHSVQCLLNGPILRAIVTGTIPIGVLLRRSHTTPLADASINRIGLISLRRATSRSTPPRLRGSLHDPTLLARFQDHACASPGAKSSASWPTDITIGVHYP